MTALLLRLLLLLLLFHRAAFGGPVKRESHGAVGLRGASTLLGVREKAHLPSEDKGAAAGTRRGRKRRSRENSSLIGRGQM